VRSLWDNVSGSASIKAVLELGLNYRVNLCELLIKTVNKDRLKIADKPEPKGKRPSSEALFFSDVDVAPSVKWQDLSSSVTYVEHGKPVSFPQGKANRKASRKGCG